MALMVHFNLELHQMNVKTMFFNGDIDETIYMVQPEILCPNTQIIWFTNKTNPSMDSSRHLDNDISNFIK